MEITAKLFATLSRYSPGGLPGTPFVLDVPEQTCLLDIVQRLGIPPEETKVVFVNGIVQQLDWLVSAGDEVGIFPPVGGGSGEKIKIDTWLYGPIARFGGNPNERSFANPHVVLDDGCTVRALLDALDMPTEERGVTFINGKLSAMPGLQPDLNHILNDGDRVAFFHLRSMWPFQYRFGVAATEEMSAALNADPESGIHHSYEK